MIYHSLVQPFKLRCMQRVTAENKYHDLDEIFVTGCTESCRMNFRHLPQPVTKMASNDDIIVSWIGQNMI